MKTKTRRSRPKSIGTGITRIWAGISLKTKLTSLSVGLIALLITISSAGTVALLRTYLEETTDTLLVSTAEILSIENPRRVESRLAQGAISIPSLPGDYFIAFVDDFGAQTEALVSATTELVRVPELSIVTREFSEANDAIPFYTTIESITGEDETWRIVAMPLERTFGSVVVALPQTNNQRIIGEYTAIGGRFGIALLLVSGLSIWLALSSALRPLREVSRVAESVERGHLEERLVDRPTNTEIGQLNRSLNSMLGSIQGAVGQRDQTLKQMRRFLSDASHELRTPLVTVRGYAELYRMGGLRKGKDVAEAMRRIESESLRMSGLVDSLLTLTRLDELQQQVREPVDLQQLLHSVIQDAEITYPKQKFKAPPTGEPGKYAISADADQLRQVFNNLISNADRFNPPGQPIELELESTDRSVVARVIDHGEGISDSLKERVFERFFRSDSSRARDTGGSGLGLAIAKSIVESHTGSIWVKDTTGGGATFVVELPRTRP